MLPLLIDENFNHRVLRGLMRAVPHLDHLVAQTAGLKGVEDPPLLAWSAEQKRVLVTPDLKTVPKHAYARVKNGEPMPGVIAVPDDLPIGQAIEPTSPYAAARAEEREQLASFERPVRCGCPRAVREESERAWWRRLLEKIQSPVPNCNSVPAIPW